MPDDRKCRDDVVERSADDVQRRVDADVLRLGRLGYNSWTGNIIKIKIIITITTRQTQSLNPRGIAVP